MPIRGARVSRPANDGLSWDRGLGYPFRMTAIPDFLRIDPETRRVSLDGRNPAFYSDPNRVYGLLHQHCPTFFWEEQRQWFFTGYDHVNLLLRDRRFGRQILHVASREELGLPEPEAHLANFDLAERYSLLEIEPPEHTRLRTLVNRAFVSRHIEKLRPEITELAERLIDAFDGEGRVELLSAFADIIPVTMIARMIGIPDETAGEVVKAFVMLKGGQEGDAALEKELRGHARKKLGPAVAPREIVFRKSLPRTRSGKIMRRLLRARELGLPEGDLSTLEEDSR